MRPRRTRSLCIEIYKTTNNVNPELMKYLFRLCMTQRVKREKFKCNSKIPKSIHVTYGARKLHVKGAKLWNSLHYPMKVTENLEIFERVVKFWDGKTCSCNVCSVTDLVYVINFKTFEVFLDSCRLVYILFVVYN